MHRPPSTGSFSAASKPALVGFWTIPRCRYGLHSQDPKYLVAEGKQSAMYSGQGSSSIAGHCFDGVHGSTMQKLLKLLDHSEEPQNKTNNQFCPLLHWAMLHLVQWQLLTPGQNRIQWYHINLYCSSSMGDTINEIILGIPVSHRQ